MKKQRKHNKNLCVLEKTVLAQRKMLFKEVVQFNSYFLKSNEHKEKPVLICSKNTIILHTSKNMTKHFSVKRSA